MIRFGALSAEQQFATRIRLARTQEVTALARMQDGTVRQVSQHVDVDVDVVVVVGGCGA